MPLMTRQATADERAADYAKRGAALDRADATGIYSADQLARYRDELHHFTGYRRTIIRA